MAKTNEFFEQYKIIVESSERVAFKRQDANKFYLTVNSVLFASAGYFSTLNSKVPILLVAIIGIITAISWILIISSYKKLNSAKFKVIHEMEKNLPMAIFEKENDYLKQNKYFPVTSAEKCVPFAFLILHMVVIIITLIYYFYPNFSLTSL